MLENGADAGSCSIGADLDRRLGCPGLRRSRERIGGALGAPADHVLINSQHTHAAPPTPAGRRSGRRRMERAGDPLRRRRGRPARLGAIEAERRLRPARIGHGRTTAEGITVNRRQRHEGGTILGWNPEEKCDRDVAVMRVDDEAGWRDLHGGCLRGPSGGHRARRSGGFVRLRRPAPRAGADWTGGECVFLQGCAEAGRISEMCQFLS